MGYKITFPETFARERWNFASLESAFGKTIISIEWDSSGIQSIEFLDDMDPAEKADMKAKLVAEADFSKRIKEK